MNENEKPVEAQKPSQDSFQVPVRKSPLMMYALLQIPIVILMVILLIVLYRSQFNG